MNLTQDETKFFLIFFCSYGFVRYVHKYLIQNYTTDKTCYVESQKKHNSALQKNISYIQKNVHDFKNSSHS